MNLWRQLQLRFRALFQKRKLDAEMEEEMRSHVEMRTQANIEAGMSPEEALYAARRQFGSVESIKETCRDQRGVSWIEDLIQDVRYAARMLRKNPAFMVVAVLTLALGIGANTAIFSAVNAVLLKPLTFSEPDRLVMVCEENGEKGSSKGMTVPANIYSWREQVEAFRDVAAYGRAGWTTLTGDGLPEVLKSAWVTGNFFDVLGVRAARGRMFREEETWGDAPPVVVLSDRFWARRFGRDPAIVGSMITVGEVARQVVGIAPPGIDFPERGLDLWLPLGWDRAARQARWFRIERFLRAIARLEHGASLAQANAQLQVVVERMKRQDRETKHSTGAGVTPLQDFLVAEARMPLLILLSSTALVLLLTCANVANLLLVRTSGRGREVALRTALGAGRARIIRQLLTESVVIALVGGVLGLGAGLLGIRVLLFLQPPDAWRLDDIPIDAGVLLFALAVTSASGILFGLAPALRGAAENAATALKEGMRMSAGRGSRRASHLVVVAEVALAVLLVTGAGLLLRSFVALRQVDPGFRIEERFAAAVALPRRYHTDLKILSFVDEVVTRLERIHGVEAVTYASRLPLSGTTVPPTGFAVEGRGPLKDGATPGIRSVAPNYFQVMGVALLGGRTFEDTDRLRSEPVVAINEEAMRQFFPNENPIGRRIAWDRVPNERSTWYRIVGVVGNEHQHGLHVPPQSEAFLPFRQIPSAFVRFVLHLPANQPSVAQTVRREIATVDPALPLFEFQTLEDVYSASLGRDRLLLTLLGAFGGLALLLASIGVYGVTAEAATRRTQEIGIRVALGATPVSVLRMILSKGLSLVTLGILLGLTGALACARVLTSVLYGVAPHDAITFLAVPAALALAAGVACAIPALRAARLDPMVALRHE